MGWSKVSLQLLIVAIVPVKGMYDCFDKEDKWDVYKECLVEFQNDTRSYKINNLHKGHHAWRHILCPASNRLHQCYEEYITPCVQLHDHLHKKIKEKLKKNVLKANETCFEKYNKPGEDLPLGDICEDYKERKEYMLKCTENLETQLKEKEKKTLCLFWSNTRACHKVAAGNCTLLHRYIAKQKREPKSIYGVFEDVCPPINKMDDIHEKKHVEHRDLRKKRAAEWKAEQARVKREAPKKEPEEKPKGKEQEPMGWWFWGMIAVMSTLAIAPLIMLIVFFFTIY